MASRYCKVCERQIESFFSDELDNGELASFLAHIDDCKDCREELTIRFIIRVGLERLEDGRTFHLGNEFDKMMRDAQKKLARRERLAKFASLGVFAVFAESLAVAIFAWVVLL